MLLSMRIRCKLVCVSNLEGYHRGAGTSLDAILGYVRKNLERGPSGVVRSSRVGERAPGERIDLWNRRWREESGEGVTLNDIVGSPRHDETRATKFKTIHSHATVEQNLGWLGTGGSTLRPHLFIVQGGSC